MYTTFSYFHFTLSFFIFYSTKKKRKKTTSAHHIIKNNKINAKYTSVMLKPIFQCIVYQSEKKVFFLQVAQNRIWCECETKWGKKPLWLMSVKEKLTYKLRV